MWLVDLLLPVRCTACGGSGDLLCESCRGSIRGIVPPLCGCCGAPTEWPVERCLECSGRRLAFTTARAAVAYLGPVRPLIHAWKERGLRQAADLAAELIVERIPAPAADAVTFIPPDDGRYLTRGHHPAERLARAVGALWELDVEPLVTRRRAVERQAGLALAERRRNVRDAFGATASIPPAVLLIDDVYTTGATCAAAASALRRGGARRVDVISFARAVR